MITFIVPTLWKSEFIYDSINEFKRCDNSNIEMIIIDNSNSDYISDDDRIRVIKSETNLFVNPSWNLGAAEAKNNYICLLNDDIILNISLLVEYFNQTFVIPKKEFGMIAINGETWGFSEEINNDTDTLYLGNLKNRGCGFGQFMILQKSTYEPIPDELKVFFGDDMLWMVNHDLTNRDNFYIKNLKFIGETNGTSKSFEEYMQIDEVIWSASISTIIKKYQ
jgi:glycosyltransferase involved in cell wall biosynthesis